MTEEKNKKEETKEEKTTPVKENTKDDSVKKEEVVESKEEVVDNKKEEVEIPEKFAELVKSIETLSVLELSELVKILEKHFGVSAAAPVAATPASAGSAEEGGGSEEKSEYSVILKEVGDKKIEVIKAVRTLTEKGLKEAKDQVDAISEGPQTIKEGLSPDDAKKAEQLFKDAGAVVELK